MVRDAYGRFVAARAVNLGIVGSVLCAEAGAWRATIYGVCTSSGHGYCRG